MNVRLAPDGDKARLTLEHIAHKDGIGEEHLKQFGPGAVGIGWDLGLYGLERHLLNPAVSARPRGRRGVDEVERGEGVHARER